MQLITAYNLKGDYKQAAEEAERMFNRAKERKDKAGMATALYATAITYNVQNRRKEEEDCFRVYSFIMGSSGLRQYPDTSLCILMQLIADTSTI